MDQGLEEDTHFPNQRLVRHFRKMGKGRLNRPI